MIFTIPNFLSPEELHRIGEILQQAEFVDGKLTAGWYAKQVKHNQQLKGKTATTTTLRKLVQGAFDCNPLFQTAVRPRKIHSILFSRYDEGMSYGRHADNALMGAEFWRSDVSFTVFLNSPSDYDGGELAIESADDEKSYKLDAGSAIVYPSSTLHRVDPVIRGTRFVAVGWVQSLIRDPSQREILFDLETVRRSIFAKEGKTTEFDLLSKSVANLLRRWAD
ncbi:PKHD-type hydroxylase [Leptolyngbya valderiana BDU 20041]|nr:Fe2+-dependent dioxygenase [Geitlerinema sp. CS-897]OAB58253.1 PKHD-type hydroxylase [Leptolyngbya valderiana BDU 20041]PPT11184.1 Iron-uptake factor PiuC [Geitlerinema sp. FC II]